MTPKQEAAIARLDATLYRARAEARRESIYHTQLGHAIDAFSALREALAEQALQKMADNEKELGLDYMAQRPVWDGEGEGKP